MSCKIILEVVVGSTLHGTSVQDGLEDLDLMAVVLEDQEQFMGFRTENTWAARTKPVGVRSEAGDVDWVGYGLRKYLHLAVQGNPSILLALFAPPAFTREITPEGATLQALAPSIVSKRAYMPFRGYMQQQYERLLGVREGKGITRPELVQAYGYDTKHASHVVRLGIQGEELLLTGRLSLPMRDKDRNLCVGIRKGEFSLGRVAEEIKAVEKRLDAALEMSPLSDKPDLDKVERWMMQTYLNHWSN